LAISNSYDVRGSRSVFGSGDLLWKLEECKWYGWPDFTASGHLLTTIKIKLRASRNQVFRANHSRSQPRCVTAAEAEVSPISETSKQFYAAHRHVFCVFKSTT
jgi:hypothetical protein